LEEPTELNGAAATLAANAMQRGLAADQPVEEVMRKLETE
jgi:hypothetical protein